MSGPLLRLKRRSFSVDSTLVMGVVNASPESFSDGGRYRTLEDQRRLAESLVQSGAHIVDIGGQSAITGQSELSPDEESQRVLPIVTWVRENFPEMIISVDTYKPSVVRRVLEAGADLINDVSGLLYPEVAELCAAAGAGLVVMHTKALPKRRLQDSAAYRNVTQEVMDFLSDKIEISISLGVARESLVVDPGPDFAKTPHQTVSVLQQLDKFRQFGRPLLLALSRKDFIGAILDKPPLGRDAGTLAAISHIAAAGGNIVRVHDVAAALDAIRVVDVLAGRTEISPDYRLPDAIRHERVVRGGADATGPNEPARRNSGCT